MEFRFAFKCICVYTYMYVCMSVYVANATPLSTIPKHTAHLPPSFRAEYTIGAKYVHNTTPSSTRAHMRTVKHMYPLRKAWVIQLSFGKRGLMGHERLDVGYTCW
jgi:hypothetical protein